MNITVSTTPCTCARTTTITMELTENQVKALALASYGLEGPYETGPGSAMKLRITDAGLRYLPGATLQFIRDQVRAVGYALRSDPAVREAVLGQHFPKGC